MKIEAIVVMDQECRHLTFVVQEVLFFSLDLKKCFLTAQLAKIPICTRPPVDQHILTSDTLFLRFLEVVQIAKQVIVEMICPLT